MFKKAERKKAKLRLALYGVTNSGKTYSALRIATGMGGKIAMIDTEAGRGEIYGNDFEYDTMQLQAPYTIERYIAAIKEAEKAGYDILIIDSLSHAWNGQGGVLSIVDSAGTKNNFAGWAHATPKQNLLIDTIVQSKMHIMVTMRAKTEWVLELNDRGKQVPRKVGLGFIQRDGVDYEFTVVMQISPEQHMAFVEKDNTKNYDQQFIQPNEEMGEKFVEWLNAGRDITQEEMTPERIKEIFAQTKSQEELRVKFVEIMKSHPKLCTEINELKDERKLSLSAGVLQQGVA